MTLRKLVKHAHRCSKSDDQLCAAQKGCYRFMFVMAGDGLGFEEVTRALFANRNSN